MQIFLLKSKIHRAAVTDGHLDYEGSLTIDADLMKAAGLRPYERILCSNMANGNRFETYVIPGKPGTGEIILNGAAAHLGKKGDLLTIMSFAAFTPREAVRWKPRTIVLGAGNKIIRRSAPLSAARDAS
ncbi:MAG TPA: aspartate 1-decarboxylase [Verrucomicrobiae bacterium]|nr:aspartate 1-decarboxylase [Verrucomicrobiae bacterium]